MTTVPGFVGKVLNEEGRAVGTCWLAAAGFVFTAAHVVTEALGDGEAPGDHAIQGTRLRIETSRGQQLDGRLQSIDPARDAALLCVDEAQWDDLCAVFGPAPVPNQTIVLYGVGEVDEQDRTVPLTWHSATGTWVGTSHAEEVTRERIQCADLLPGMSGAAVTDAEQGRVLGMLIGRYNSLDGWLEHVGWIIPQAELHDLLRDAGAAVASPLTTPIPRDATSEADDKRSHLTHLHPHGGKEATRSEVNAEFSTPFSELERPSEEPHFPEDPPGDGIRILRRTFISIGAATTLALIYAALQRDNSRTPSNLAVTPSTFGTTTPSDLTITPTVFGARIDPSNGPTPGGIKFTINNNRSRTLLIVRIRIQIEDYSRLELWTLRDGIGMPTFCDSTLKLPLDTTPGVTIDRDFDFEVKAGATDRFIEMITLDKEISSIPSNNTSMFGFAAHIYRLHATLIEDDGTEHDTNTIVAFADEDDGIEEIEDYWIPASTLFSGSSDKAWKSREEWVREVYSQRIPAGELESSITQGLTIIEDNEKILRRILLANSAIEMSPKMKAIKDSLTSGQLNLTQINEPPPANIACPSPPSN